jgi:hypothetical protein
MYFNIYNNKLGLELFNFFIIRAIYIIYIFILINRDKYK